MIEGLSVLAIVPARGGSKGIARKNLQPVGGKPLIAWTLEEADCSKYLDRVIVSSDDAEIIKVARGLGADVPFVRPAELARDETPGIEPVLHALDMLPGFDLVVLLQPTSPLRRASDIDSCIEELLATGASACVTVAEAVHHPYWTYRLNEAGRIVPFIERPPASASRRQDLPRAFALNGAVYVARVPWLREHRTFLAADTACHEMPADRSADVDSVEDLVAVERTLNARHR